MAWDSGWRDVFLKENLYFSFSLQKDSWGHTGGGGGLVAKSCPPLVIPQTIARQAPLSMGFPRQKRLTNFVFIFNDDKFHHGGWNSECVWQFMSDMQEAKNWKALTV